MGGEIIAEKFALLRTLGGNGVAVTHLVEDTLLGERAVVKIGGGLEAPGLEYLKAFNLARELEVPGLLMPFEGGLLEEEAGYYLAFPELEEPSLENYRRLGGSLPCREVLLLALEILRVLEKLHAAGFLHLFINPRNVFYRPRRKVTLKDPALRPEFFAPLLEEVASPDFSYFSPGVMDGGEPGAEADLYALGILVRRMLEEAPDRNTSPHEARASELAEACLRAGDLGAAVTAAVLLGEFAMPDEAVGGGEANAGAMSMRMWFAPARSGKLNRSRRPGKARAAVGLHPSGRSGRGVALTLAAIVCLALLGSPVIFLLLQGGWNEAPAGSLAGGSFAGRDAVAPAGLLEMARAPAVEAAPGTEGTAKTGVGKGEEAALGTGTGDGRRMGGDTEGVAGEEGAGAPVAPPLNAVGGAGTPPVASFALTPSEGRSPLQVQLDASSSHDPDGRIVSYAWSCGGVNATIYHIFESNVIPARISVTLTVTDDAGNSSSVTRYVTLY